MIADASISDDPSRLIDLDIPNDVRFIERVVARVQQECLSLGFTPRQVMLNVSVALSEALSNAILRGNSDDPSKKVHVRATIDRARLVLEIHDDGKGFDIEQCTIDVGPDTIDREDGRGLFLMKKLMDRVERVPHEPGNTVRMTLNRA
jgi:serine/threonine-protein kinase RsbW